jgi:DNA repair photolyase
VKGITGVEADYDAGSLTFEVAVARLHEAGVAGLIYTTLRIPGEVSRRFRNEVGL